MSFDGPVHFDAPSIFRIVIRLNRIFAAGLEFASLGFERMPLGEIVPAAPFCLPRGFRPHGLDGVTATVKEDVRWTPRQIKQLCSAQPRTLFGFGKRAMPPRMQNYLERLSRVAEREGFLKDWNLAGSMTPLGDLESADAEIARLFRKSVECTARQLAE